MGVPSEADSVPSPVSPDDYINRYPLSPSQIEATTRSEPDQSPLHGSGHDLQLPHGDPEPVTSLALNYQTTQNVRTDLTGSSWSRFTIPTRNKALSSGFPFHPRLYDLKITHDQWNLFSSDIVDASKLSATEDYLAWTTGITTGTLSSPFLLVFSPWVGYLSGRAVHRKTIQKTVKKKLQHEGDLRFILRQWNEETFMPRGFQAWLELPLDPGELHKEYHLDEAFEHKGHKYQKKAAKKAAKRFRILIIPNEDAIAQSNSSIPRSATPVVVEAATGREAQELHDIPSEPPAYQ